MFSKGTKDWQLRQLSDHDILWKMTFIIHQLENAIKISNIWLSIDTYYFQTLTYYKTSMCQALANIIYNVSCVVLMIKANLLIFIVEHRTKTISFKFFVNKLKPVFKYTQILPTNTDIIKNVKYLKVYVVLQ